MMVTLQRRNALSEKKALWAFLKGYLVVGGQKQKHEDGISETMSFGSCSLHN